MNHKLKTLFHVSVSILSILLSACSQDKEVSRKYGETRTEVLTVSCPYFAPGYCMDCGIAFSGKYDCALRWKPFCRYPGKRKILADVTPLTTLFESGVSRQTEVIKELDQLSDCKRY